jgi:hypothetical protein
MSNVIACKGAYLFENNVMLPTVIFFLVNILTTAYSIAHWQTEDQLLDLILCFKLLFGADPGIMSRSKGKPIFDLIWNTFMSLLDDDHPFKVKNSSLDLLPIFICMDDDHTNQVI